MKEGEKREMKGTNTKEKLGNHTKGRHSRMHGS
jgi:hypothetical protein